MTTVFIMLLLMTSVITLTGIIMAITPYLMKKGECFTVTVPDSAAHDPVLRGYKRTYAFTMLVTTALLTAAGAYFSTGSGEGFIVFLVVAMILLCGGGYGLMLYYRQKVHLYKQRQNWVAETQEAVALLADEDVPVPVSLKWNLLHIPLIVITLLIGVIGYSQIPDQVVIQIDFAGNPYNIVEKSPFLVLFAVLLEVFIMFVMIFCHWTIFRSKRDTSPGAPATSALAYGMFARVQSIFLVGMGLALNAVLILIPLSFMSVVSISFAGTMVVVVAFAAVIVALAISVVYGQGGSRLFARMETADGMTADNDVFWKLGIFYWNPEDSSLFLPKRFGIGWTVNFARPAVWLIMGAFILLTVGFVITMLRFA